MSESSHSIQIADMRSPLARAIYIVRDGRECPTEIIQDFSSLIIELSTKHFGISSEVMVENALKGADSLVSASLTLASGRNQSDIKLSEILKSEGIRGVCSIFSQYVKEIIEGHTLYKSPQLVLGAFFLVSSKSWSHGYKLLLRLHSESKREINMVHVKDWLLRNTKQGRILQKNPPDFIDPDRQSDEVIRRVILQYCDIKNNIETDFSSDKEKEGEDYINILVGPMKYKSAKIRFEELISKMPIKLRLTLSPMSGASWFDENIFLREKKQTKQKNTQSKSLT